MSAAALSPMFRQYRSLKQQHSQSILLFRMGDFYEMFYDDAKDAAPLLELTLTARGKGTDNVVPMCGFPHHQLDAYAARLVRANRRVAVCDQVEDPKTARGLVRREVVRIITPGTVTDPAELDATSNLWIAAVCGSAERVGAAFLDVSTGEFLAWDGDASDPDNTLAERLHSFEPREIVVPEGYELTRDTTVITAHDAFAFAPDQAEARLARHFAVASLDGFGFRGRPAALAAAAGLMSYVRDTQRSDLAHVDRLQLHEPTRHLTLDAATRRNLEIERSLRDGARTGSLLQAIDTSRTPGGARLMRRWLAYPLCDRHAIDERLDGVEELVSHGETLAPLREQLRGVYDIERLLSRTVSGTAGPRDLLALRASLERLPELRDTVSGCRAAISRDAAEALDPCTDLAQRLAAGIVDQPPVNVRDGNVIRDGFDPGLDELRAIRRDGTAFIASLETAEREATGIASLKVKFNKVFGYFIEISRPNLHLVPERYVRKQTIAGGERFITPDLKEYEAKVLQAQERIAALELELFHALRAEIAGHATRLKAVARAAATLDVVGAFAETALRHGYCRPVLADSRVLSIGDGRHPVVEQNLVDERFVPNDTTLTEDDRTIGILTGPNMGGKSTFLRQVALITLMAQAGSFVPAGSAEIGIVDRIFCRVGASDSLVEGQSTFMVEMAETANILHNATSRSLVLLDEIGRGTSTFDGLSIAWAVVEHLDGLARTSDGAPRTLFATHYHELTELAVELPHVFNVRMAVREHGEDVVFLHRVESGVSDRSYGIHVARLAGVPQQVVGRAREILATIESDEYDADGRPRRGRRGANRPKPQRSLFEAAPAGLSPAEREVLDALRALDPDELTPLDALTRLAAWVRRLDGESSG